MKTKFYLVTTILAGFISLAGHRVAIAQCDKLVTFTASKTNYMTDKGVLERTKEEETIVTLDKKDLSITTGGNLEITGAVKTYQCNWPVPFKTGKTVITTTITDGGQDMTATITIEGIDGKITLTFEALEMPGKKIQLQADKFE